MKQAALALNLSVKKTRKREFLEQMEHVVPWAALVELIAPFYPEGRTGRPPFSLATMLRIHFMQQWFSLSDPAMEEAFFDTPLYRGVVCVIEPVDGTHEVNGSRGMSAPETRAKALKWAKTAQGDRKNGKFSGAHA